MSDPSPTPPGVPAFADSLAQLEAQIATAESRGEPVPPEARIIAAKLRDLVAALADLTSSFSSPDAPAAPVAPDDHDFPQPHS